MERLTKQWGNNHAVPTEIDLDFMFRLDDPTSHGLTEILDRLAAYEDTGLEPEGVQELVSAKKEGRLVVLDEKTLLAISAGARAIENNKRLWGTRYCWNVFGVNGEPKEISYYEAANILRQLSEPLLDREEAEAALEAQKGGEG